MGEPSVIDWTEGESAFSARWQSESGQPPPRRMAVADDRMSADDAYGLACQGTALLWRGDFQNGRQLLRALASRAERPAGKAGREKPAADPAGAFHRHRQAQAQRARTLGALLVLLDPGYGLGLRRAPDWREACREAWGDGETPVVVSLRELLGLVGAHEWRKKGIEVSAAGGRIHPHYGVFAPIRQEYVDLVAKSPLPLAARGGGTAFDIGTGTGVLAAVLARRGVARIVGTDVDARALACARENLGRLGLSGQVELAQADLYPEGRADLVVCNPPWVPARPASPLERGIFDPESAMLRGYLAGLAAHLAPGGEGWLVLSDLAEHLGLRTRAELEACFTSAGLRVIARHDAKPRHPKAADESDPLHAARSRETTSLWRLAPAA